MSDPVLDAFHAAADTPGQDPSGNPSSINAVLSFLQSHASILLDSEHAGHFATMSTDGQRAIAAGLCESRGLFGNFLLMEFFRSALEKQVQVEYAKHLFVTAINSADRPEAVMAAIDEYVGRLDQWR